MNPAINIVRGSARGPGRRPVGGRSVINMWAGGFLGLGILLVWAHGQGFPVALMWSVACLGIGGLLGFLFGIPRSVNININQPGVAAVNARVGEVTTSDHPATPPPDAPAENAGASATVDITAIPTTSANPATPPPAVTTPTDQTTTHNNSESNLEQVSDWVTKLLLGGSLTQIEKIPGTLANWGSYVASGLGDNAARVPANQAFATALIVYFLVLGFIAGYVITKVELGDKLRGR